MPGRLDGAVAVITGAASGLGLASAERFAEDGARVVCADVDDAAARAAERVEAAGAEALGVATDVTDAGSVERMAVTAIERFAKVDVLLANAGIPGEGAAHATSLPVDGGLTAAMVPGFRPPGGLIRPEG